MIFVDNLTYVLIVLISLSEIILSFNKLDHFPKLGIGFGCKLFLNIEVVSPYFFELNENINFTKNTLVFVVMPIIFFFICN